MMIGGEEVQDLVRATPFVIPWSMVAAVGRAEEGMPANATAFDPNGLLWPLVVDFAEVVPEELLENAERAALGAGSAAGLAEDEAEVAELPQAMGGFLSADSVEPTGGDELPIRPPARPAVPLVGAGRGRGLGLQATGFSPPPAAGRGRPTVATLAGQMAEMRAHQQTMMERLAALEAKGVAQPVPPAASMFFPAG
ncbi:MAG: hypothetical protein GY772_32965, partial [bacterium]|nr:hypothetical protein [bacterium]